MFICPHAAYQYNYVTHVYNKITNNVCNNFTYPLPAPCPDLEPPLPTVVFC